MGNILYPGKPNYIGPLSKHLTLLHHGGSFIITFPEIAKGTQCVSKGKRRMRE
jgi:hypothetical protein